MILNIDYGKPKVRTTKWEYFPNEQREIDNMPLKILLEEGELLFINSHIKKEELGDFIEVLPEINFNQLNEH